MAKPTGFEVVVVFKDEAQAHRLAEELNNQGYLAWVQGSDASECADADFSDLRDEVAPETSARDHHAGLKRGLAGWRII